MTEITVEWLQRPYIQALLFILLTLLFVFIVRPKNADKTWSTAGLLFIVFMLVNSVLICTVSNSWSYFFYSLGCSVLYLGTIAIIIPFLTKILKIEGSGESAMVFIWIIYHPIVLLIVLSLKWTYFKFF